MAITLKNVVFTNEKFMETIKEINESKDLAPKDSYNFFLLVQEIENYIKAFESTRIKLVQKYGTENEEKTEKEGVSYSFTPENMEVFSADFNELLNQTFDLQFEKIKYPETLVLSPSQLAATKDIFDFSALEG